MRRSCATLGAISCILFGIPAAAGVHAQTPALPDPVLERIWNEGMHHSQLPSLAHVLLDSIGPRLAGSPAMSRGRGWLLSTYEFWGVRARNERYGSWKGWRRGISHVDMLSPRVRSLEGALLAWSRSTSSPITAPVVLLPDVHDQAAFDCRGIPRYSTSSPPIGTTIPIPGTPTATASTRSPSVISNGAR